MKLLSQTDQKERATRIAEAYVAAGELSFAEELIQLYGYQGNLTRALNLLNDIVKTNLDHIKLIEKFLISIGKEPSIAGQFAIALYNNGITNEYIYVAS